MTSGKKTYKNAESVLPGKLLREVQKYARGHLWVPSAQRRKVKTMRDEERNRRIYRMRKNGMLLKDIAEEIGLCPERIRQIVKQYSRKT